MKNQSVSQKIRVLIERGHSNKYIVEKLQCSPRTVYNIRYRVNKDRGIAALGKPAPKPVVKPVRVKAPVVVQEDVAVEGTGISEPPAITFVGPEPIDWNAIIPVIIVVVFFALVMFALVVGSFK